VLWRDRSLLGLLTAELVSLTGTAMTFVALPWFIAVTTGSAAKMGWVLAAELAPVAIFGIPAGTLVARLGAKRTMLLSDAARVPLLAVVPVLWWTGQLSFPALLGTTFAIGCFAAPYYASSRLVVPEVAGEDERAVAGVNAILGGANQLTQIVGPVLAGLLIAASSPAAVLCVDAGTYLFSFLTIALAVRAGRRVEQTEESRGVLAGLRFVLGDRLLGPLLVTACVINFVAQGLIIGLQWLAFSGYDQSAHVLGFLFAGFGAGALLGAIAAQRLVQTVELVKLAAAGVLALPLPIFLLALPLPWQGAMLATAACGFCAPIVNSPLFGIMTVRTPQALRPKVLSAVMTVASLAGPLGFLAAGEALRRVSVQTLFLVIAALLVAVAAVFAGILLRNGRESVPVPA
jgi:MFS family permease